MAISAALVTGNDWVSHDILMEEPAYFLWHTVFIAALSLSWVHSFKSEGAIWVCTDAAAFRIYKCVTWRFCFSQVRILCKLCVRTVTMRYESQTPGKYHSEELKFLYEPLLCVWQVVIYWKLKIPQCDNLLKLLNKWRQNSVNVRVNHHFGSQNLLYCFIVTGLRIKLLLIRVRKTWEFARSECIMHKCYPMILDYPW